MLLHEKDKKEELRRVIDEALRMKPNPSDLQAHIEAVKSKDQKQRLVGIIALRKLLSNGI